jgi:hypothetical protein
MGNGVPSGHFCRRRGERAWTTSFDFTDRLHGFAAGAPPSSAEMPAYDRANVRVIERVARAGDLVVLSRSTDGLALPR